MAESPLSLTRSLQDLAQILDRAFGGSERAPLPASLGEGVGFRVLGFEGLGFRVFRAPIRLSGAAYASYPHLHLVSWKPTTTPSNHRCPNPAAWWLGRANWVLARR